MTSNKLKQAKIPRADEEVRNPKRQEKENIYLESGKDC